MGPSGGRWARVLCFSRTRLSQWPRYIFFFHICFRISATKQGSTRRAHPARSPHNAKNTHEHNEPFGPLLTGESYPEMLTGATAGKAKGRLPKFREPERYKCDFSPARFGAKTRKTLGVSSETAENRHPIRCLVSTPVSQK